MTKKLKKFVNEVPGPGEEHSPERRHNPEWYEQLVEELNNHADRIEGRLHRFFKKALIAFAVIGFACTLSLIGFKVALNRIQDARYEFVFNACEAQNERHDNTRVALKNVAEEAIRKRPDLEDRIRAGIKSNQQLINALAPKQDCDKLGKVAIGEKKPPPPKTAATTGE